MKRTLLLGATSALMLNACATADTERLAAGDALDNFCQNSQVVHCVDVKVAGGAIVAIADTKVQLPNHFILWRLSPILAPYSFADNGIQFKTGIGSPQDEFRCKASAGGKLYFCVDRNSTPGVYPYTVTLNKDGGGAPLTLDPKIVNQ
jgi:hypothetical protein